MTKIENAIIERTMLGTEDHGILTAFIHVSGDGWGCGFGGYSFDGPVKDPTGKYLSRCGSAYGTEWIRRVLDTLEVEQWEKLKGTIVRVETNGLGGGITKIGHAYKDRWFEPKRDLAYLATEAK